MKNFTKKALAIATLGAMSLSATAADGYFDFSYQDGEETCLGVQAAAAYFVAIRIVNKPELVGKKIVGITAPIINDGASEVSCWLSMKGLDKCDYKPDIMEKTAQIVKGEYFATATVNLDEPYTITEDGVYVGYTFVVNKVETSFEQLPIIISQGNAKANSLFLAVKSPDLSEKILPWQDGKKYGQSCLVVHLLDEDAPAIGGTTDKVEAYALMGSDASVDITFYNTGADPVKTLEYVLTLDDQEQTVTANATNPVGYLKRGTLNLKYKAPETRGWFSGELKLTKINDQAYDGATTSMKVATVSKMAQRYPLVEELSATGCPPCARGYAGLEALREAVPTAIIAAYHTDVNYVDPMHMLSQPPSNVFATGGVPDCNLDREYGGMIDPYFGFGSTPLGIIDAYKERGKVFTPAEATVTAEWADEEKNELNVKSKVTFRLAPEDDFYSYRIMYLLTADGLSGTTQGWTQQNAYAGQPSEYYPGMDIFTKANGPVKGLKFNDIVVYKSGSTGIKGSLPETNDIVVDTEYTHEYTIPMDQLLNTAKQLIPVDKDKLTVICVVLEQPSASVGYVVNAAQYSLYDKLGVDTLEDEGFDVNKEVKSVVYYDFAGTRVVKPVPGMYVRVTTFADGTTKSDKVAIK